MSTQEHFVGDDVLFQGVFKVNGVEQTPSSVTVTIKKTDGTTIVEDVAGTISSNNVEYQYNDVIEGQFKLYFTADFGAEQRTGVIPYRVKPKDGVSK